MDSREESEGDMREGVGGSARAWLISGDEMEDSGTKGSLRLNAKSNQYMSEEVRRKDESYILGRCFGEVKPLPDTTFVDADLIGSVRRG